MEALECLTSPVIKSLFIEDIDNSTLSRHLGYAIFIMNYLDIAFEEHIESCAASFLYAIVISFLASLNTVCSEKLIDARTTLNDLINTSILVCLYLLFLQSFFSSIQSITETLLFRYTLIL